MADQDQNAQVDWAARQQEELSKYAFPGRSWALIGNTEQEIPTQGLTKREYFAACAVTGMSNNAEYLSEGGYHCQKIAAAAVKIADALIKELDK